MFEGQKTLRGGSYSEAEQLRYRRPQNSLRNKWGLLGLRRNWPTSVCGGAELCVASNATQGRSHRHVGRSAANKAGVNRSGCNHSCYYMVWEKPSVTTTSTTRHQCSLQACSASCAVWRCSFAASSGTGSLTDQISPSSGTCLTSLLQVDG